MSNIKSLQDAKATLEFMIETCSELEGPDTVLLQSLVDAEITRTASPRFTAEEREAIKELTKCAGVVKRSLAPSGSFGNTPNRKEWSKNICKSIATVRAMLTASEIEDKGKG